MFSVTSKTESRSSARRMEWTNLRAEETSNLKSRKVLGLVSMARAMLKGIADSFSNTLIVCGIPSSSSRKSSFVRSATGAPRESVTVVKTFTNRPDRPVFKVFFLPDRDGLFQCVDQPAARLKSRRPMYRCHPNQDACLSNLQPA